MPTWKKTGDTFKNEGLCKKVIDLLSKKFTASSNYAKIEVPGKKGMSSG